MARVTAHITTTFILTATVHGMDMAMIHFSWIHGHSVRGILCGLDLELLVAHGVTIPGAMEILMLMVTIGDLYLTEAFRVTVMDTDTEVMGAITVA